MPGVGGAHGGDTAATGTLTLASPGGLCDKEGGPFFVFEGGNNKRDQKNVSTQHYK